MGDDNRAALTGLVLALLDQSFQAHQRGDVEGTTKALAEAIELDAFSVDAIHGGIMLGEIPNPETDPDAWAAYVAAHDPFDHCRCCAHAYGGDHVRGEPCPCEHDRGLASG